MSWEQRFVPSIPLPGGAALVTVRDAGNYIAGLSKGEQDKAHWRKAIEVLLLFGQGNGDPMMARIAMMQALHHGQPAPATEPRRKRARVYKIIR